MAYITVLHELDAEAPSIFMATPDLLSAATSVSQDR
jgi:hypothetical protein